MEGASPPLVTDSGHEPETLLFDPPWAAYFFLWLPGGGLIYVLVMGFQLGPGFIPGVLGPLLVQVAGVIGIVQVARRHSTRVARAVGIAGVMIWAITRVVETVGRSMAAS